LTVVVPFDGTPNQRFAEPARQQGEYVRGFHTDS